VVRKRIVPFLIDPSDATRSFRPLSSEEWDKHVTKTPKMPNRDRDRSSGGGSNSGSGGNRDGENEKDELLYVNKKIYMTLDKENKYVGTVIAVAKCKYQLLVTSYQLLAISY
jgi:hypothetical protein